ncbi:hypothetical protein DUI87_03277 [Hirundo rustica rustica]|uniref:Uncharacterized protein n=1 Tax=Hirundo rustica rustica TaxID=333673 RepID=A0A3M0L318_HIRRU|nr:hypothetical protein DUI87_03277 [Hirundo rustica rustica]
METLKNILAAKKMVYLAAGGNPVGRGEGRGIHLWAILVILSLAMYPTNGLPNPEGQMGQEKECLKENQREPTRSQKGIFKAHFDCPKIQKRGICSHNESWFKICELKENTIYHNPVAMSRKRRELDSIPVIPICEQCNKTVWVGGKKESTFVAYLRLLTQIIEQRSGNQSHQLDSGAEEKRKDVNRLIRLQAVVEIVSNHTSDTLELLAQQHSQMRAFVYQNRITLDYLLAEEGGVCGKFNESECCIEINDYGETIKRLAAEIKKPDVTISKTSPDAAIKTLFGYSTDPGHGHEYLMKLP